MYEMVQVEEHGNITVLKFNRPEKLNALHPQMSAEAIAFFRALNRGEYKTRCVILTGEGRGFCAGGDVTSFPSANPERQVASWRPPHVEDGLVEVMRRCNTPIIGAINGYAVGAGFGVALATDLRVAADDARFQVAQVKRGVFADFGLGHFLKQQIGPQRALDLMLTARMIDAQEALALGLVLKVVPLNQLLDEAMTLAQQIAKNGPMGLAASKRVIYMTDDDAFQRVQEFTGMAIERLFLTEDAREGARSFFERREPEFRGR